jgi:hypothetical protein
MDRKRKKENSQLRSRNGEERSIPLGHSSAQKKDPKRASERQNQKLAAGKSLYHNTALSRSHAKVCFCILSAIAATARGILQEEYERKIEHVSVIFVNCAADIKSRRTRKM